MDEENEVEGKLEATELTFFLEDARKGSDRGRSDRVDIETVQVSR